MLNSIWMISLCLGTKEVLLHVQLVPQVPGAYSQAPVDVIKEVTLDQIVLQGMMDGVIPEEVILEHTGKYTTPPDIFLCHVCTVCPVCQIKTRLLETSKPMLKYPQQGPT